MQKRAIAVTVAVMLPAICLPSVALASDDNEPATLDKVVVIASRAPQAISAIPATVWVIEREQLERQTRAGVPLKEAVAQLIPGLDIGAQGRTNFGQNLRGRSVLVMIDGVSLNSARSVSRQFDSIDPFNIERIEVLSGASAVHGGGATGGVVNIVTRRGDAGGLALESELGGRSGLHAGDDLDWRVAQSVEGGTDAVAARLALAYQDNGGAYDANGDQVLPDITQTDLQYNRSLDLMGNVDFRFDGGRVLRLGAQVYRSGYEGDKALYLGPNLTGVLGRPTRPELIEVRGGFDSDMTPRSSRWQANADFHAPDVFGGQDVWWQGFTRSETLAFNPFPGVDRLAGRSVPYYSASRQETGYSGMKLVLEKRWPSLQLTYGIDHDHERFDATQVMFDPRVAFASGGLSIREIDRIGRYPRYTIDGLAGFAQAQWKATASLSLSAGWRRQHTAVEVDDFIAAAQQRWLSTGVGRTADAIPGGSNDYDVDLFNAGAIWATSRRSQVWSNYSEGFDLPDPGKYYGQGSYQLQGSHWRLLRGVSVDDSPLSGIKTRQVELGWRLHGDAIDLQAAAFHAWSDRDIVVVPLTLAIDEVDRKVRNRGVEAQASWQVGRDWQLGANALAIRTERQLAGRWQRAAVTDASPSKLGLFSAWEGERGGVRLQWLRAFDLRDGEGRELDGYATADLLGHWKLPAGTLNVGIQNLANADYATHWGQRAQLFYGALLAPEAFAFNGRGRTFGVSYSARY
ncbi:TonB-dependent receptor [Lysobacter sp. GCM10012299]|uniref:TonB-dependent receptor n=1 Tax=Lysobacter sp. GCM10012299 TaxID=3317333 RepID=UPI00360A1B51